MPIINFYKTLNKVEQIDASPDAETVYNKVREALLKARENKLF
jgi:adenylate kinase family enzyme